MVGQTVKSFDQLCQEAGSIPEDLPFIQWRSGCCIGDSGRQASQIALLRESVHEPRHTRQ